MIYIAVLPNCIYEIAENVGIKLIMISFNWHWKMLQLTHEYAKIIILVNDLFPVKSLY